MNPILRNILAVIAGWLSGGLVNMGIIMLGTSIIASPEGVDVMNADSIREHMHLYQPYHFIFPFLAHAVGTLAGAYLAALIAASYKMTFAMVIGALFLAGGIAAVFMIPAPLWFIVLDLALAYIPMAWLGGRFAVNRTDVN